MEAEQTWPTAEEEMKADAEWEVEDRKRNAIGLIKVRGAVLLSWASVAHPENYQKRLMEKKGVTEYQAAWMEVEDVRSCALWRQSPLLTLYLCS